jgi:hypothetical protein
MREDGETVALAEEAAWRERAMWLLVRALGGKVSISDEQWAQVPERPELVIDRSDGVMRWTAREHEAAPAAAEPAPPQIKGQLALDGDEPTARLRRAVAEAVSAERERIAMRLESLALAKQTTGRNTYRHIAWLIREGADRA